MKTAAVPQEVPKMGLWDDVLVLVKARLSFLVLITTLVGFLLGWKGPFDWVLLTATLLGTALCAAGSSALNQWWERDIDAQMKRTMDRPLPARRMRPVDGLLFGLFFSTTGLAILALFTNWDAAFLPAQHSGTLVYPDAEAPIADLHPHRAGDYVTAGGEAAAHRLMAELNRGHAASREGDQRLDARIRSYELAARMQLAAPEALDLKSEPEHVMKLYGLDRGPQAWPKEINAEEEAWHFGRKCLAARRLLERQPVSRAFDALIAPGRLHALVRLVSPQSCAKISAPVQAHKVLRSIRPLMAVPPGSKPIPMILTVPT